MAGLQATRAVFAALRALGSVKEDVSRCFLDVAVMLLEVVPCPLDLIPWTRIAVLV